MDVAIFGSGAAGLMTAITLNRTGHKTRIFERCRQNHGAGMGFILVPECIQDLQKFGIEVPGMVLKHYLFRNSKGDVLRQEMMPPGSRGARRRDLIAALVAALPSDNTLTFGANLESLQLDENGKVTNAHLSSAGQRFQVTADLYVAADGVASRGRQTLFPQWPTPRSQVIEMVGLVKCKSTVAWTNNNFHKFHAAGGGIALGVVPMDPEHVVWYVQFDTHRFSPPRENAESRRVFVNQLVGEWAHPIPHLIANTDFSCMHLWLPVDTDLIPCFGRGNLVLVGDAAHPLLPFTSQGVAAAVADAVTLANVLESHGNVAPALDCYTAQRHRHCSPYVARGRELMQDFLNPRKAFAAVPIA